MIRKEIIDNILYNEDKFSIKWMNIEFSSICNLNCKWCTLDHKKRKEFLPENILHKLLVEIKKDQRFNIEVIDLHNGGEILLDPDFKKKIILIGKYKPNAKINMLTNGLLLNDNLSNFIVETNVIDLVRFSVDGGTKEQYENIRKGAKWSIIKKNISDFIKINNRRINTGIICIVPEEQALNCEWMEKEFREVLNMVDHVEYRHPHNWDGSINMNLNLSDYICVNDNKICKFLKNNIVVLPNGDVTVCCADLNSKGIVGNLNKSMLSEIVLSRKRIEMIRNHLLNMKNKVDLCKKCIGYYE